MNIGTYFKYAAAEASLVKCFTDYWMTRARKATLWIVLALVIVSAGVGLYFRRQHLKPLTLRGAVTVQDADPRKQLPIAGV